MGDYEVHFTISYEETAPVSSKLMEDDNVMYLSNLYSFAFQIFILWILPQIMEQLDDAMDLL